MLNCNWAQALTRYDCRTVTGLDGETGLEIGTPFSLPDGSAISLYVMPAGTHILLSDNGDTLFHLGSMGLDVWQAMRLKALRETAALRKMIIGEKGDLRMLARQEHAAHAFAEAVTTILAISDWASQLMKTEAKERDIIAEAEPYIIARDPKAAFKLRPKVRGESQAEHTFDILHGNDLIDVIAPHPVATGGVMRKVGDVTNGPYNEHLSPLIIVDDRVEPAKAHNEMGIIASISRVQSFTSLMNVMH